MQKKCRKCGTKFTVKTSEDYCPECMEVMTPPHFYRIDDAWGGTGKALVYADGKSSWTVSRKHEDQYKLYEIWRYCKGAEE